jgi:hypothetical protein
LFHDVYVHRDVPVTHELRVRGAALLLPSTVVTGISAAVVWGVELAGAQDDVEVTGPPGSHMVRVAGVHARRARLDDGDVCSHRGVRVTTPEATAVRVGAALRPDDAVVGIDRMIAARVVDLRSVRARAARARGPGAARARRAAALADGLAESPQETRLRLVMTRGGLPPPIAQYSIRAEDRFVARVDFAWPDRKVAVEYDGLWHSGAAQFAKDRARLNRLQEAGWRVVFVTAADLRDPVRLVARIAAALASAR